MPAICGGEGTIRIDQQAPRPSSMKIDPEMRVLCK